MKKTYTKIYMSVLLSCALTINAEAAGSLWDNDSIFKNATEMSVATDPISGATYISGGGIEVRFKKAGSFPPIFTLGAPGLKASCRGISFDAGYASFMNLERLGQQLSQAGASVAYGVLIGLVYTLPGVEQAFSKLNEWSQWIQSFLNDSCNIGQNFGRSLGGDVWGSLEGVKNDINNSIASPQEYLDEHPNSTLATTLKKIYNSGTTNQKAQSNTHTVYHILKDVRGSLIATYLNTLIKKGDETISFPTSDIASIQNLDSSGFTQSTLLNAYFLSALMSNTAISETGMVNALSSIKTGNADKIGAMIEEINANRSMRTIMARNNASPEAIINLMLNGNGANPNFKGLRIVLFNLNDGKGSKEQFVVLTDQTTGATSTAFDSFEGYIGESKKLVYFTYNKMVQQLKDSGANNPINAQQLKVASVYPNMTKILKNLVLYHGKSTTYAVGDLIDPEITETLNYLAYNNAIRLANQSIDNINHVIHANATEANNKSAVVGASNPDTATVVFDKANIDDMNKQIEVFEKSIATMKDSLYKISDAIEKDSRIRDINDKLEKAILERNIKGTK